jgi:hypothetical protein
MSLSKHRFNYLPQIATTVVAIALSVALTLMAYAYFRLNSLLQYAPQ